MHMLSQQSRAPAVTRGHYLGQLRQVNVRDLLFVCQHELVACVLKIVHKSLWQTATA